MQSVVSVVVPAYNGAAFIGQALESVFAQSLPPREVIVVDDASTDDTAARVEDCAKSAPLPVRLLRLRANSGGPARPINLGVDATSGKFVAVLDQDDVFLPDKLRDQTDALRRYPDAAFAFSLSGRVDAPADIVQHPLALRDLQAAGRADDDMRRLDGRTCFRLLLKPRCYVAGFPGFLFRRADWALKGGCDERLRIAADYDLLCWLSRRGGAVFLPRVQNLRREHAANLSKRADAVYLEGALVRIRYLFRARVLWPELAGDADLRQELPGLAYWLRESGHYLDALRCHFLAGRLWGLKAAALPGAAKVVARCLWSGLGGRKELTRNHGTRAR